MCYQKLTGRPGHDITVPGQRESQITTGLSCAMPSGSRDRKGQTKTQNPGFLWLQILESAVCSKRLFCCILLPPDKQEHKDVLLRLGANGRRSERSPARAGIRDCNTE